MDNYRVSAHNERGITLGTTNIEAESKAVAQIMASRRFPHADRIHVDRIPPPPADGKCWRCGSNVTACGGPSDPHE